MSIDRFAETFTSWGQEVGQSRLTTPITHAEVVAGTTLSDFVPVNVSRALYVGVTGDVKVDLLGVGTGIIFKAMPVGWHPMRVTKVYYVGDFTTATDILSCD